MPRNSYRTPKRHYLLFATGAASVAGLGVIIWRASADTVWIVSVPVSVVLFAVIYLAASTAGREALASLALAAVQGASKIVELRSGGLLGGLGSFSVTSTSAGPTPEEEAGAAAMNRSASDAA